ncbi:MAG: hypothetical protein CMH57_14325 [Myxococcales bacterium]|nr:hypothetical protein [Myxococcales bacterium]
MVWLVGCRAGEGAEEGDAGAAQDAARDAAVAADSTAAEDTAAPPDSAAPLEVGADAECTDEEEQGWPRVELALLVLDGGETVSGELIATFNHNYWWDNSAPELTYALFEPDAYAPFPDDRSVTLVSSRDVRSVRRAVGEPGRVSYARLLRQRGLVLSQVPIEGPTHVITGHESYHREENGFGDYAWDLVLTDEGGARFDGDGTENADHYVWDAEVTLPVAGYVVEVVRDQPDNDPGFYKPGSLSNYIGLQVGGSYYVYLLHLREGTIPDDIEPDMVLPAGTYVGRVGNSGVTLEPHLHMTAFWYDADAEQPRYWSVPMEFNNIYVSPSPLGPGVFHEHVDPPGRSWIASEPFK